MGQAQARAADSVESAPALTVAAYAMLPAAAQEIKLQAGIEFYFEEGELFMPAVFDQTPEEIKAGF